VCVCVCVCVVHPGVREKHQDWEALLEKALAEECSAPANLLELVRQGNTAAVPFRNISHTHTHTHTHTQAVNAATTILFIWAGFIHLKKNTHNAVNITGKVVIIHSDFALYGFNVTCKHIWHQKKHQVDR